MRVKNILFPLKFSDRNYSTATAGLRDEYHTSPCYEEPPQSFQIVLEIFHMYYLGLDSGCATYLSCSLWQVT